MGTITSGVGLISGINSAQLIQQLLAIEARPKDLLKSRNAVLTSQNVAYADINAKLLSLKLSASSLSVSTTFKATKATSSNEDVLKATSGASAAPGSYNFTVARLVTTQQLITQGFADKDAVLAPAGATLTFEFGDARLDTDTDLRQLNGGAGITRGKIRVTDRSGATAMVDLSQAMTVNDVLEAINGASGINVTASVNGDGFVITDNTGQVASNVTIANVGTGTTATSLGIAGTIAGPALTGTAVNTAGQYTQLASLNDGNGVRQVKTLPDFQITTRDGAAFSVDLGDTTKDLGDVAELINTASAGSVTASFSGGSLQLTDNTAGATTFAVSALNSSNAALDLGILTTDGDADGIITGGRVLAGLNSKLVKNLNGGTGAPLGSVSITNRTGAAATNVDLSGAQSISDVIGLINNAGAGVTAALNSAGNGLTITDNTGATASNLIIAGGGALELGIEQNVASNTIQSGNRQLKYVSESTRLATLNGGKGIARGKFTLTDSTGATATVDLTQGDEVSIADVISEINSRGLLVNARVNDNGDGITIEDTGPGVVKLKVEEAGSTTAADLGIKGEATNAGDDLVGSYEKTVTVAATDTLNTLITKINDSGLKVAATVINDGSPANPFRLSLQAKDSGRGGQFVFDDGGLGFGASELSRARDAAVFFGSANPALAIAITSPTNTLDSVVPGVTINLTGTSTGPVQLNVTRDTTAAVDAVKKFVDSFNSVIDSFKKYDSYNAETEEKGLLLGDSTISGIRAVMYRLMNNRNGDLSGQYTALSQIGVKVVSGAKASFDQTKFTSALANNPDAILQMFTFKETQTDPITKEQKIIKGGFGVRIDEALGKLTASNGNLQNRMDAVNDQIELNTQRAADIDKLLAAKKARLEGQFNAMELALAKMQSQSSALSSLQSLAASSGSRSSLPGLS